jgi:hypothetical protein
MRTLTNAKVIKALFEIDSLNDAAIYTEQAPGYPLAMRLKMIESSAEIALEQAEADYQLAWVADGLPGKPALLTPDNVDAVIEYLANAGGSWTVSDALREQWDI